MKRSYQSLEPQDITITASMKEIRRKQPKARSDIHPSLLSTTYFAVLYNSTPLIDFELGYISLEKDTVLLEGCFNSFSAIVRRIAFPSVFSGRPRGCPFRLLSIDF